jgi:MFS family permease
MIYLILFLIGNIEEIISISYYRLAHKGYKIACAIVSMIRIYIWAFIIQTIFKDLNNTFWIITSYAIGSALGDYISLTLEPFVDKVIFKFKRRGRKKKRLYLINERKE